jgi:hypothetical protein
LLGDTKTSAILKFIFALNNYKPYEFIDSILEFGAAKMGVK